MSYIILYCLVFVAEKGSQQHVSICQYIMNKKEAGDILIVSVCVVGACSNNMIARSGEAVESLCGLFLMLTKLCCVFSGAGATWGQYVCIPLSASCE